MGIELGRKRACTPREIAEVISEPFAPNRVYALCAVKPRGWICLEKRMGLPAIRSRPFES